jgi:hypothetical protein
VCGRDVELQLLDQSRQAGSLAFGKLENKAPQRRRIDDRVLERALEPTTDQPAVESVMAVLYQHGALRKAQETTPRVLELRRADEHRPIDVMPPFRVGIDRRLAIDQCVEERQGLIKGEPLGAQLENQERGVAGRLDIEGHELRIVERCQRPYLGCVDCNLLPGHELSRAARLEIQRLGAHRASARARRAHPISSPLRARSSSTAAA